MRAAQFHARRNISVTTTAPPPPSPPPASHITIDIHWCGICGTDLHEYLVGPLVIPSAATTGPHPLTGDVLPLTMGHEFCGRVQELPEGYTGPLKVGAAVMVDPRLNCQKCGTCVGTAGGGGGAPAATKTGEEELAAARIGKTNLCDTWGFLGLSGGGGGLSETICVREDMCYALPEGDGVLRNAALIEPLAVARHGVKRTRITSFRDLNVLVLGGGPIGLAVVMDLKVLGVKQVIVSEPTETRQKQVGKFVDVVLDSRKEDVPKRCKELTGGRGVDVVFDCAGVEPAMLSGMAALGVQGKYMNVAGWETPFTIPMIHFMMKEIDVMASFGYDEEDFAQAVKNYSEGMFRPAWVVHVADNGTGKYEGLDAFVTARIRLEDVQEAGFEELVNHKDKHIKILVTPKPELLAV